MKYRIAILILLLAACGGKGGKKAAVNRFYQSMQDIGSIATLQQVTDDNRSIYQVFGPGDTIAFYQRLLLTDAEDTSMYFPEDMVKPYGKNLLNGDLYTLSDAAPFPENDSIFPTRLPSRIGEETVYGVQSPIAGILAYETATLPLKEGDKQTHRIYLVKGDTTKQLTYGDTSVFLDRFSKTGRYLTAVYGTTPTWLLIFDIQKNKLYRINHDSSYVDYLTCFSSDDSEMMFIRSNSKYRLGRDFFGDIWLVKFDKANAK